MGEWRNLEIQEAFDDDGVVRLTLVGELDLASVQALEGRLDELRRGGYHVRLDLAQLEFMDSTGLGQLVCGINASRQNGWHLEIGRELTEPVRRVIELTGTEALFWPNE
jgi:anti-anti-sigma factor